MIEIEIKNYLISRIKSVDKCYEKLLTDIGDGQKIINVTGLSKKEKEKIINKRNCLLVQKHCELSKNQANKYLDSLMDEKELKTLEFINNGGLNDTIDNIRNGMGNAFINIGQSLLGQKETNNTKEE